MTPFPRFHPRRTSLAILALLVLTLLLLSPMKAQALTWKKDGVTSVGAADCVIVADFRNPSNIALGSAFRRDGNNLYAVYTAPNGGGTWSVGGSILLTYKKGLLDNKGTYHDLHVKITDVNGVWKSGLTTSPKKTTVRQRIAQLANGWISVESASSQITYNGTALTDGKSSTGMNCGIYAWADTGGTGLLYNLLVKDIDQPNFIVTPNVFGGAWQERVGLRSAELKNGTTHVEKGTYLAYSSNIIVGTKVADSSVTGSIYTAAFAMPVTLTGSEISGNPQTGFAIGWSGSQCQTRIFEDLSYSIVTKAGAGGACKQVAGTDAASVPISLTQKPVSDGVFVTRTDLEAVPKNDYIVTVTPKEGYEIDSVTLDGKSVTVSDRTGISIPIEGIVADHVVTATFRALPDVPEPDPDPGSLVLQKVSARTDITSSNPCYSLEGAQYDVYADEECTELVTTLVTDADGVSRCEDLEAGTYYVHESVASPGYHLDETVHVVDVLEGSESELEVTEEPMTAELALVVQKCDADFGTQEPQGSASLEGATFSVSFYAGTYTSTDELPEAPTRTWTLVTDEEGRTAFDEEHMTEGDEPYRSDEGGARLPLGTILVREELPSPGYDLPATPYVLFGHVVQTEGIVQVEPVIGLASLELEVHEPVQRGGLKVKKVGGDQNPLAGAVFALANASAHPVVVNGTVFQPGEVCLTLETTSDGIAATPNNCLPYGRYELREQKAPRGFKANAAWKKQVDITEAGKVVDLTDDPLVNEPVTIDVVLKAHKSFDGTSQDRELEADMFSFSLADEEGNVIDVATNDAEGTITFKPLSFGYEDLEADHHYTITEVEGDDEEIVYDTHVEEVCVRITARDDGELSAEIVTDDDGVNFENHTVEKLELPMTGRAGIHTGGFVPLAAIALGLWEGKRRRGLR